MRKLSMRLFVSLLALAALYLIPVNLALNLPATRDCLNRIAPERFAIEWSRAWSWYPLRVELRGLAADGQTATEQWQVDSARAAASVSLLPLLREGLIRVHDLDLEDLDVRLRPRPQPGRTKGADDALSVFFPVIRNRDPAAPAEPSPPPGGTLRLEIDDLHLQGRHAFWVSHFRGTLPGEVRGSLSLDSVTGQIGLADGTLDLRLQSLAIGGDQDVSADAAIKGRIEIPPFAIAESVGIMALAIPWFDAEVDLPVRNLDFLPLLVGGAEDLKLQGQGRLRGRLVYAFGELLIGTDLHVDAPDLGMQIGPIDFTGNGQVQMLQDPADQTQADLRVHFNEVQAHLLTPTRAAAASGKASRQEAPLFVGHGLEVWLHARTPSSGIDSNTDPRVRPKRDFTPKPRTATGLPAGQEMRLTLTIPEMRVPDIAAHNRLLPAKWRLALLGGKGVISGRMELALDAIDIALDLGSDRADLRWRNDRVTTDLLVQLRAAIKGGIDHDQVGLDLTGTRLRLNNTQVAAAGAATIAPKNPLQPTPSGWQGDLRVERAALRVPARTTAKDPSPIRAVAKALADQGFGALLSQADGQIAATLTVSQLDWIAALLNRPLGLNLTGAAEIDADIRLADGWPTNGTRLKVPPMRLGLALLEHQVEGRGQASLTLEHSGKHPRLRLDMGLADAQMRRQDESQPGIAEVRLDASVAVTDPFGKHGGLAEATLKLHSARVHDMATYNAYLPANAPLTLVGGEASLVGDLQLGPQRAKGTLLLVADGVRFALDRTELSGDLRLDVLVRDGSPADMWFDVTGTKLALERVRVKGPVAATAAPDWYLRLQLEDTQVRWHKPMHLTTTAGVSIKDTRPFVALMDNARGQHPWIDDLLTVEDLGGHLRLIIDGKDAVLQDAMVSDARMGVHAKGHAGPAGRKAMLLVRWHDLVGALELQGARKHFDIVDARARFDAYRPGAAE